MCVKLAVNSVGRYATMQHHAECERNGTQAVVVCHGRRGTEFGAEYESRTNRGSGRGHKRKYALEWRREVVRKASCRVVSSRRMYGRRSTSCSRRRLRVGNGDAGAGAGEANEAGAKEQHQHGRASQKWPKARAGKRERVCGLCLLRMLTGALLAAQALPSHGYGNIEPTHGKWSTGLLSVWSSVVCQSVYVWHHTPGTPQFLVTPPND